MTAKKPTAKPVKIHTKYTQIPNEKRYDNTIVGSKELAEIDVLVQQRHELDKKIKAILERQETAIISIFEIMRAEGITLGHLQNVSIQQWKHETGNWSVMELKEATRRAIEEEAKEAAGVAETAAVTSTPAPKSKAPPKAQKAAPKAKGKPQAKTAKYAATALPAGGVHFFNPGTILDVSAKIRDRVSSGKGSKQPAWVAKRKPIEALPVFLKSKKASKEVVENLRTLGIL
jgi:hypothetical protein